MTAALVGHRNTRFKTLRRCFKAQRLAWTFIKLPHQLI